MNKLLPILIVISLLMGCSSKESKKNNSSAKVSVQPIDGLKIAFYSNDSLKKHFEYFKKEEASIEKMKSQFETKLKQLNSEYEAYVVKKDQEARAGLLSQNEMIKAQEKAQQLQQRVLSFQQNESVRIESETLKSLEAINKKVTEWGKIFSEENNIDLLLAYDQGGQFNYINPTLDVTEAFVIFLNENQKKIEKELK